MAKVMLNSEQGFYFESLKDLAEFCINKEGLDACASINFVTKEKIRELNKTYRNIDSTTDVLSFESDIEGDIGDIFICLEIAEENAKKLGTSLESELRLLVVHGMLHLCGYDHIDEKEAQIMEAREEEILDEWESRQL